MPDTKQWSGVPSSLLVSCVFFGINSVADHIGKLLPVLFGQLPVSVEFGVCRLFGIFRIDHYLAEPAFYPPY